MHLQGREACTFSAKTTHGESHLWRKPLMAKATYGAAAAPGDPPLREAQGSDRPHSSRPRTVVVSWGRREGFGPKALGHEAPEDRRERRRLETCPVSTGGRTRRVHLVQGEGGGRGGAARLDRVQRGAGVEAVRGGVARRAPPTCEGRGVSG